MNNKKTNRFIAVLLSLCTMLGMLPSFGITAAAAEITAINTVEELKAFRDSVNSGDNYSGKTVTLNANLDLSGETNWTPIGTSSRPFKGTFDGGNHVIYNLTINTDNHTDNRYCGLFGYIDGAVLQNLGIEDAKIASTDTDVAILSGYAGRSNIKRCYVTGSVKGYAAVSGLLGSTYDGVTAVENCYARVDLTPTVDRGDTAGISGWNSKSSIQIVNCYSACIGEQRPIAGWSDGAAVSNEKITNTYFDSTLSPNFSSDAGRADLGRTSAQLKTQSTFDGWDFAAVWAIDPVVNGGYPYLRGFPPGLGGAPGSISVTVIDTSGNPVTDAAVSIKHTTSHQETSLSHQGNGVYSGTVDSSGAAYDIIVNGETVGRVTQTGNGAAQIRVQIETHTHCVCGGNVTTGSHVCSGDTKWTAWRTADAMPAESGSYYLTGDVNLSGPWVIPAGVTIALCLNGHTLKYAGNAVVHIQGGTLNICDCADNGRITGGNGNSSGAGGIFVEEGTVSLYSGSISGNKTTFYGGGVRIGGDSTAGTFFMYGGSVSENEVTSLSGGGGGIYVSNGAFIMYDGSISNNTGSYGGGVYVNKGSFVMNGGSITGNTASARGGGIMISDDDNSVALSGAPVITGNTVNGTENNLYLLSRKTITVDTLTQGAKIGVTTSKAPTEGSPVSVTGRNNADYSGYFTSDDAGYVIENSTTNTVRLAVPHIHRFTVQSTDDEYLKTPADCEHAAVYYTSCACGESSEGTNDEATFTSGAALGHAYGAWSSNGNGTHTRTCAHDSSHIETKACSGGTATYFIKAVCQDCQAEYGALLTDTTAPTGEIALGENRWNSFLNTITFGLFFKETQTVTITANDDSCNHDGYTEDKAVKVEYYLSEQALTETEAKAIEEWSAYTDPFNIDPNHKAIVYVKLTDHAGNKTVISSDGIVLYSDATPAELSISFVKGSDQDVTAGLELKGNTVNAVLFNGQPLTAEHYTVSEQGIVFKASWLDALAAGNYTLTIAYNPLGEKYISDSMNDPPLTTSIELTVSNAELSNVSVEQTGALTYNGQPQTAEVAAKATAVDGQTVAFTYSDTQDGNYSEAVPAFTEAGTHTVFFKASAPNHNDVIGSFTVIIEKQTVTEPTIVSKTYTGANLTAEVSDTDLYTVKTNDGGTATGNYHVVLVLKDSVNYKWSTTEDAEVTLTFTITATVNAWTTQPSISGWTYGQTANAPTGAAKFGTVIVSYTGTANDGITWDSTSAPTKAGSYTATFTVSATNDYGSLEKAVDFTIERSAVTVTADNKSKTYGDTDPALTYSHTALADNDSLADITVTREDGEGADTYPITVSQADGANPNYTITFVPGTLTIDKADLTVTAENKTVAYGDAVPSYTVTYRGFKNSDTAASLGGSLAFDCNYAQFHDKGEYTVTPKGYTSDNYNISYVNGTLKVNPKPITVTIDYRTSVYGDDLAGLTAIADGIVNEDTNVYKLETAASKNANVGKYDITGTVLDENYSITFENETDAYEITPRELTVDVRVKDKQFDGLNVAEFDGIPALKGLVDGDAVVLTNGTPTFTSVTVGENIAIALTEFSISGEDADNYILTQPNGITANITNEWVPAADTEYAVSAPNANGWLNADFVITANGGYELSLTNTADGQWSNTLASAVEGADCGVTFFVRNTNTGAISLAKTESYKLDKNTEATGTTGKVYFDERNGWEEFLHTISFGLIFKDEVTVIAEATDALSGVEIIEYVSSDKALTLDEVIALADWTVMPEDGVAVTLEDTKQFVYYVRIKDNAGNITYFSTNGAEYDATAPAISGIENGGTYYTTQKVTVADKNLDTVTLNDVKVTGSITLDGNKDAIYTMIATDKAGNRIAFTVTMKPIASIGDYLDEITGDNVKPEDREKIQDVIDEVEELLKDEDLTEQENVALKEIKDKAEHLIEKIEDILDRVEKVEELIDGLPETMKKDDIDDAYAAKKAYDDLSDYEKTLVDPNAKKKLDEAVKKAAEVGKIDVPQTGDNSNLWLWTVLAFISGGSVLTMTMIGKKKKNR